MADNDETTETSVDLGAFVPETFKGEDGGYDTAGFRAKFDEMASTIAEDQERRDALPKSVDDYAFALAEDHQWPEGFDIEAMKTTDEQGNEVAFDPASLLDQNDPDVKLLQAALHEAGAPQSVMNKLAGIMANREIRATMKIAEQAATEKKALGPDAQSRIDTLTRTLQARLPKEQAAAVLDSLTTADSIRGMQNLLKPGVAPPAPAPAAKPDYSEMSIRDRLVSGYAERAKRSA